MPIRLTIDDDYEFTPDVIPGPTNEEWMEQVSYFRANGIEWTWEDIEIIEKDGGLESK